MPVEIRLAIVPLEMDPSQVSWAAAGHDEGAAVATVSSPRHHTGHLPSRGNSTGRARVTVAGDSRPGVAAFYALFSLLFS
jgi:hypothetical protein